MITGSHNPPDYNGFKMMLGKSVLRRPDPGAGRIAAEGDLPTATACRAGRRVQDVYIDRLLQDYHGARPSRWPGTPATARPARP